MAAWRIFLFLPLTGLACERLPPGLSDTDRQRIATSIDSATRAFEAAERAGDPDRVIAALAPDFYMYQDGLRLDYATIVPTIRQTFATAQLEPAFSGIEVRVLGPDAAVASFTFRDRVTDSTGAAVRLRGATTLVWERRDGR